ncbi:matrix remodeling-associated protein 8-like isoform X3 [Scleropages formosus]|uniref:matrix remodeling-associated protein 8-like isoform X3 n=1 Tax=Scleropages formosus TaxID=113540 RepID=UPI0010FA75B3|nr:matrix remodeling-associated protein 8-like isoform X3 [Scleropages formosus]
MVVRVRVKGSMCFKYALFRVKDFKMHPSTTCTALTFLLVLVQLSESNGLEPVTADVKSSALLPCTGTAHRGQAEVKWTSSGDPVFVYHQGKLTTGPGFKNRVHLSKEEIEGGNFSLIISPVEYSDKGLYSCFYNNEWLHDVRLDVVVPTVVSVPVGDPVKLHCYADINRQTEDSQLDVRWKKEGKLVLHLHSGLVTQGSGFKNRVDVSKEDIRKGDLSLILNDTRLSDQGHYQCFYNDLTGCLGRVTLNIAAHEDTLTVSGGQSIILLLRSTEPARVQFFSTGHWIPPVLALALVAVVVLVLAVCWYCRRRTQRPHFPAQETLRMNLQSLTNGECSDHCLDPTQSASETIKISVPESTAEIDNYSSESISGEKRSTEPFVNDALLSGSSRHSGRVEAGHF